MCHWDPHPPSLAGENDEQASGERNVAAVSPIPKIVTTPIKEEANMELDGVSEWGDLNFSNLDQSREK